ncbi:MAG: PorV/PorQ family protein [Crocinitomicaceae bacterium]|nr:PorV/PorQ family protein [Crocinitomicaceae bacterium]
MKNYWSLFASFVAVVGFVSTSYAQTEDPALTETVAPKYSNEFLAIGVGADALGLGNAVVAQTDGVSSGYWNPAGLTKVDKWLEVGLMHSEYFAGIAKYDYVGLAHSIDDKSAIGFTAIRFGVDDIPNTTQLIDNNGNIDYDRITTFTAADYGFLFSYARKLDAEGLSVGGTFKVIHRKVGDFAKSWGFGIDAGAQYEMKNNWKFGLMARDVTSTFNAWVFSLDQETREVFVNTGNAIPENGLELTLPRFIFAAYKKFDLGSKGLYASSEVDFDLTTDGRRNTLVRTGLVSIDPHLGVSVGFKNYISIRAGLSNMQYVKDFDDVRRLNVQPNIGIGLNFKSVYLDYAFTDIGDASVALYSHVVSLRVKLNQPKNSGSE